MTFLEAIILGFVQGLTEFLPISSSGHLMLGEYFFGYEEPNLLFNVVLHMGTLVAVTLFYRKDVFDAVTGAWQASLLGVRTRSLEAFREKEGARLAVLLVLAMIPTGVIGLLLRPYVSTSGLENPAIVPYAIFSALIITGCILFSARFFKDENAKTRTGNWTLWNITPQVALWIGVAQGLAVIPGFSRSGLTIVAALWLYVYRAEAARFSFLLSIPAVAAAMVLEAVLNYDPEVLMSVDGLADVGMYTAAAVVAGIIGYLSILVLVNMLKKAHFWHFAWYCWVVGIGGLAFLLIW